MKFTPKTADELARESLLAAGTYPFEVMEALEKVSQKGNDMIKLKLNVFGPNGEQAHVYDYLLESMAFKLRHFAETTGLLKEYDSGQLSPHSCIGKGGFVKLGIEESAGYPPKNAVKDYIVQHSPAAPSERPQQRVAKNGQSFDDDIPF